MADAVTGRLMIWDDPSPGVLTEAMLRRAMDAALFAGLRPQTIVVSSDVYTAFSYELRKTRIFVFGWDRVLFPRSTRLKRRIERLRYRLSTWRHRGEL
jgi:hypothetical protein